MPERRSPLPTRPPDVRPARRRGRPRKDARRPDGPDTRESIVRSAAYLFATRGFERASLADIAAAADVTTGAIYAHFTGKSELLVRVIEETLAFLSFRTESAVQEGRDETSLVGYVHWLLRPEQRTTRALINEVFTTASRHPEVAELVTAYARREAEAVAAMIGRWQAAGRCDPALDPLLTAEQFFTEVLGLCRIDALAAHLLDDERWLALVDWRVRQLLHAAPT